MGERLSQSWLEQEGPRLQITLNGEFPLSTCVQSWLMQFLSLVHTLTIGERLSQSWFTHMGPFLHTTVLLPDSLLIFSRYFMSSGLWRELEDPDLTDMNLASLVKPASLKEVRVPIFKVVVDVRIFR